MTTGVRQTPALRRSAAVDDCKSEMRFGNCASGGAGKIVAVLQGWNEFRRTPWPETFPSRFTRRGRAKRDWRGKQRTAKKEYKFPDDLHGMNRKAGAVVRSMCIPFVFHESVNVGAHLLKKLIPAELPRMSNDFFGIEFDILQTPDGRRDGLDGLFGKENT